MAFDTLAFVKRLKKAGIKRRQAEAHAEAINQFLCLDVSIRSEMAALEQSTKADLAALEQRIDRRLAAIEHRLEPTIYQTQLQTLGIMAATLGILFVLRKLAGSGGGDDRRNDQRQPLIPY